MLQLLERRGGAPRIRRPRLRNVPPRKAARPLAVAVLLLALTVAGMLAGLRLAGRTTHPTALGTISFSVSPSIHGRVDAFVPIADWGARAHAFQAPITVHVEPRAVNRKTVLDAAGGNGTALAQAERDSRRAARSSLLRAYRFAIVGALVAGLLLRAGGGGRAFRHERAADHAGRARVGPPRQPAGADRRAALLWPRADLLPRRLRSDRQRQRDQAAGAQVRQAGAADR